MGWLAEQIKRVYEHDQRLKSLEEAFKEFSYSTLQAVQSHLKKNWATNVQAETMYGLRIGLCVCTQDPFAQGRIKFYMPGLHEKETKVEDLPWAWPISVLGGFDDSGALWVPPAGSSVAVLFELGDREAAYYFGTIWDRDRGTPADYGYQVPEYDCIHKGHRKGYWVGPNDESQVLPPQNTYNYNIKDFDDLQSFEQDTEALNKIVPSHLHEIKTEQKHRVKFDDGNYFCNHKWKHLEIGSSCGHSFIMWDDHMHRAGQHANPLACSCGPNASGGSGSGIECGEGPPMEANAEQQAVVCTCRNEELENCENSTERCTYDLFKHESEARPWRGPCTPQNNKCELIQSGTFQSSISGHIFVTDDEVEEPRGVPNWERGTRPFDFGCTDKFFGKTKWVSATGHLRQMGDAEREPSVRDGTFRHPVTGRYEPNGILDWTATGHFFEMNDDTLPGGTAGPERHIRLRSTSNHLFEMVDFTAQQESPGRSERGSPSPTAKMAYVRLRTGYGLQLLMRDDHSQEDTQTQFIELLAPHKDNCHGPHIFRMQEQFPESPGLVFLRCGGYFFGISLCEWIEIVGSKEDPMCHCGSAASKITYVSQHDLHITEEVYIYLSELEFHFAEQFIILAAGRDCPDAAGVPNQGPCVYPIVVGKCPWACPWTGYIHWGIESLSDRVFASASMCGPGEGEE